MTTAEQRSPHRNFTAGQTADVLSRDPECVYCGATSKVVDHVFPWARGGTDYGPNLAGACRRCNDEKSDATVEEWKAFRLERGLPWPPVNDAHHLLKLVVDAADAPGAPCSLEELVRRMLQTYELGQQERLRRMPHGCGPHEVRTG